MKKVGNVVDMQTLKDYNVPEGYGVVVYDKKGRRAMFYAQRNGQFRLTLVREKRKAPILVRDNDFLVSMDTDGTMLKGDIYGVFAIEGVE